jgi:hypothetical protein
MAIHGWYLVVQREDPQETKGKSSDRDGLTGGGNGMSNIENKTSMLRVVTYLHVAHLIFAHHLDGNLSPDTLTIPSAIDIAECAIAHLLEQLPPLEAGVIGELVPSRGLLGETRGDGFFVCRFFCVG